MINLLQADYANSIRFFRQNVVLRNWLIAMAGAIIVLLAILAGGWLYINHQTQALQKNLDLTNQQLKDQNLAQVQKDAKEISGDIKVITQVLNSEVKFSDLIQVIGSYMPKDTVLAGLSISKVTGGLDLTINAKSHQAATQAAINLSDKDNKLFAQLDINSVSCNPDDERSHGYICTAVFRTLFSPEAKNRFINVPKVNKQ
jgi:hypothetical protein